MSKSVFITGATGYIGGEVLYQLLKSTTTDFKVSALVRSQAKADLLTKKTNGKVTPIIGCLDDLHLISKAVEESDIIVNTANVDHVPSAEVLSKALLSKTTKETILVHTSGTSVIGDPLSATKSASKKVYSDSKDIAEINSLPSEQPHRPVDEIILDIQEANPKVKVAIVCPSNIVGISNGFDKIISVQIPELIRFAIKNKQAFSVYSGDYIWSHIDIKDLGELYIQIVNGFLQNKDIPQGKNGYYFGSYTLGDEETEITTKPSAIEHTWRQVSENVGELLHERKLIPTKEVADLSADEIRTLTGYEFAPFYWGSNSRSRGDNGKKIGFIPKNSSLEYYWKAVEDDVEYILENEY